MTKLKSTNEAQMINDNLQVIANLQWTMINSAKFNSANESPTVRSWEGGAPSINEAHDRM